MSLVFQDAAFCQRGPAGAHLCYWVLKHMPRKASKSRATARLGYPGRQKFEGTTVGLMGLIQNQIFNYER